MLAGLRQAHARFGRDFPGDSTDRQPIHTVYGGAQLFRAGSARKIGTLALKALDDHAPDDRAFASAFGLAFASDPDRRAVAALRARIVSKLRQEPVEDYRIDFEDGYGHRSDAEEDGHCVAAAGQVAEASRRGSLPPFIGLRVKPLSAELQRRSVRTLELFVTTLRKELRGSSVPPLRVTVPKVVAPQQVAAIGGLCGSLERRLKLGSGALRLEVMIETPQAILAADGRSPLRAIVAAGRGRVAAAHFGAYDYTALCGITASFQDVRHPACDFARHMMQVALAQTGVQLSDSVTTTLPTPIHRGPSLTSEQQRENTTAVHRAWRLHFDNARHSLTHGFYQGWDLHPAQLPARYAAVYDFFASARAIATARLRHFVEEATQATLVGNVFDDAATGQGLVTFFLRGLGCGALSTEEATATGLSIEELQARSFAKIIENRRHGH